MKSEHFVMIAKVMKLSFFITIAIISVSVVMDVVPHLMIDDYHK